MGWELHAVTGWFFFSFLGTASNSILLFFPPKNENNPGNINRTWRQGWHLGVKDVLGSRNTNVLIKRLKIKFWKMVIDGFFQPQIIIPYEQCHILTSPGFSQNVCAGNLCIIYTWLFCLLDMLYLICLVRSGIYKKKLRHPLPVQSPVFLKNCVSRPQCG